MDSNGSTTQSHGEVILYARVSTTDQKLHMQKDALEKWAVENASDWGETLITDEMTGTTMDRPGWREVERRIEDGSVDTIVVWKMDRLGRGAIALLRLMERLREKGINLISLRDNIDLSTSTGRLIVGLLALLSEWENELRSERVRAGMAAAKLRGKRIGGQNQGQRSERVKALLPDIEKELRTRSTIEEIASRNGVSPFTVRSILREMRKKSRQWS